MPLYQRDFDQAARYLRYACELLASRVAGKTVALRELLEHAARRLSPGDIYGGNLDADVAVLLSAAEQIKTINPYVSEARTEVMKAIAVLRDRGH